jgi:hypothetical protein
MSITLRYKFAEDASLEARVGPTLDITRTTQATMVDADGWIRQVQDGEARFSGAAWSQNLCEQSQTFDNAAWVKTRSSISADVTTSPDGGSNADELIEDNTASSSHLVTCAVYGSRNGHVFAHSVYLKANTRTEARLSLTAAGYPNNTSAAFDLSGGTVGTVAGTGASATISDAGNGWYRCTLFQTCDESAGSAALSIQLGSGSETWSYNGDGSSSIYIYGAQVEDVSGKRQENALLYSEAFDQADWSKTRTTITSGGIAGPDGSTASSLDEDSTAADNHFLRQNVAATLTASVDYTFSIYLKEMNRSWVQLRLINTDADSYRRYFNLNTGALGTATGTGSAGIEDVGDGWYRCSVTMNMSAGIETPQVRVSIAEADNDLIFDGLGQQSVAIYGAQLQEGAVPGIYTVTTDAAVSGAYSPSTYISTTTAAVTSLSGANDGLLVEEARTNICLQSEDFDSTGWTLSADTVINDAAAIAPDGSLTAQQIIDDNGNDGKKGVYSTQLITVATLTTYTYSCYAKADQLEWFALRLVGFTTPAGNPYVYFNLSTGVVGTVNAGWDDTGIEDAGNGWYRCWGSFTTDAADTSGSVRALPADSDGTDTVDTDGTSSIFVWGAQIEAGAFPTSYIPTVAASVTRNADYVRTADLTWFDTTFGTFYVDATSNYADSGNTDQVYNFNMYFSSVNYYRSTVSTAGARTGRATFSVRNSTTNLLEYSGNDDIATGVPYKGAMAFDFSNSELAGSLDGGAVVTKAITSTEPTPSTFIVGSGSTTVLRPTNGPIAEIVYDDTRLDDDTLLDWSLNGPPTGGELRHNQVRMAHKDSGLRHNRFDMGHNSLNLRHKG